MKNVLFMPKFTLPIQKPPMTEILLVCTANRCRSVMAEALLARRLRSTSHAVIRARSAGLLRDGEAPPAEVMSVIAGYGIDVSRHRSRAVSGEELLAASLIVAMTREQLREIAVRAPAAWRRAFTLKELVRRGESLGSRLADQSLADWLDGAHAGRDRMTLLGDSADDDIADPFGGPLSGYVATAALLDDLLARLVRLCWPLSA